MAQNVTIAGAEYEDVPAVKLPKTGGGEATFYDLSGIDYAASNEPAGNALKTNGILYGQVDSTSTSTVFTAQIDGVTEYYDGLTVMLKNGYVTSTTNFTININSLGAKPCYNNMATGNGVNPTNPTRDTTIFNINYTMLFIFSEDIVSGGGWICYRGYDANTNTIGYQLRTNSSTMPMKQRTYRYRILFTALDGQGWVPSNTSTSTNATAKRDVNQAVIDPFGEIVYYGTTASVAAGSNPSAAYLWQEYTMTLGYAFNRTGAALVLPYPKPIYIKAAPQTGGGAIIDADEPYVFTLPSTEDGKIYIYLGRTYSATSVEITMNHPVYYFKDGAIREWTNAAASGSSVDPATSAPLMDGTAAVGSSAKYAREDHVHPSDTSRLGGIILNTSAEPYTVPVSASGVATITIGEGLSVDDSGNTATLEAKIKTINSTSLLGSGNVAVQPTLVSGTNIKTVNNESLLGSGNIAIQGGGTAMTDAEIEEAVDDGWGSASLYSITTESSALTFWESWSDEHNVSGQITSAAQGTTVYIDFSPGSPRQMTPSVSMSGGGTISVTAEYSAFAPPFGGVYSFTMPNDDVTVSLEV